MTRAEALLKLLKLGGLSYREIAGNMGGSAFEVHEAVAYLRSNNVIKPVFDKRHKSPPIYEITPEYIEKTAMQELPSSQGNELPMEPVRPDLHLLRGEDHPENSTPTDTQGGEIKAVYCPACGLDSIRGRRGHAEGTCRHKTVCGSTVI